ncbi:MAG: cytidine/deoxycytidylate deaminase family protein [Planctomycetota bacterium]|nr:cytidine/deoxycytidylate deaminase family protein [Planctomycetota bacterium]
MARAPYERPTWDEYFISIAWQVATRSTCLRRQVGAVLVNDKRILATGYNGAPRGMRHCAETGCLRVRLGIPSGERHEICRALHAEMNAILQAACHGIRVENSSLYCTTQPCALCAKMLINVGVRKIFIAEGYPDELAREMLAEAGVEIHQISVVSADRRKRAVAKTARPLRKRAASKNAGGLA